MRLENCYIGGAKRHQHRLSGPSMWRGTCRAMADWDEDEDLPRPVKGPGKCHKMFSPMDYIERRSHKRISMSWKDQEKAFRQWAKRKPWKGRPETMEPAVQPDFLRLMAEIAEPPADIAEVA